MKSKITIDFRGLDTEVPGNQFEPVIRAVVEDSEDVRDGLMKAFFESLGRQSNWLNVDIWSISSGLNQNKTSYTITPINPKEILSTMSTMIGRVPIEEARAWLKAQENFLYEADFIKSI